MPRLESNVPLAARVAEQLRQRIGSGEFAVGARLPTELELAEELGVSRNSVREGLRALVHAGMVRARAGDGTYVTASDALAPALRRRATTERAVHVEEVRRLLEREGARRAASELHCRCCDTRVVTRAPCSRGVPAGRARQSMRLCCCGALRYE